jgi:hypothetical protein
MRPPAFRAGSLVPLVTSSGVVASVLGKKTAMWWLTFLFEIGHKRHLLAFLGPVTLCLAEHRKCFVLMCVFAPGSWLFRINEKGRCRWNVVSGIGGLSAYFFALRMPHLSLHCGTPSVSKCFLLIGPVLLRGRYNAGRIVGRRHVDCVPTACHTRRHLPLEPEESGCGDDIQ